MISAAIPFSTGRAPAMHCCAFLCFGGPELSHGALATVAPEYPCTFAVPSADLRALVAVGLCSWARCCSVRSIIGHVARGWWHCVYLLRDSFERCAVCAIAACLVHSSPRDV